MKNSIFGTILKFCFITNFISESIASPDCGKMPHGASAMCCNLPSFKDIAIIESIVGRYSTQIMDDYMMECKINEELAREFKVVKNGDIDLDLALKRIDDSFENPTWRKVYKDALQKCLGKVNEKYNDIQTKFETNPFNIQKSKCDIKFMAVFFCLQMDVYINCPAEEAVKTKDCEDVMDWMRECHKAAYSFREVSSSITKAN